MIGAGFAGREDGLPGLDRDIIMGRLQPTSRHPLSATAPSVGGRYIHRPDGVSGRSEWRPDGLSATTDGVRRSDRRSESPTLGPRSCRWPVLHGRWRKLRRGRVSSRARVLDRE